MKKGNPQQAIIWTAGFFDGEGTVAFGMSKQQWSEGRTVPSIWVSVGQKERAPLDYIQANFGGSIRLVKFSGFTENSYWCWRLCGKKARKFIRSVYPYAIVKKERMAVAMELSKMRPGMGRRLAAAETERLGALLGSLNLNRVMRQSTPTG